MRGRVLIALVLAAVLAVPATAGAGSLYGGPGHRPGPDILYRKPLRITKAPQLKNRGPWHAPPILVSGASAYRAGEFLYQDWLFDDHGANGTIPDPSDPRLQNETVSQPNGRYTYPTDGRYANNLADIVEFRVKRLRRYTAFRITMDSMADPDLVGETIAIGDSSAPQPFPYGANASAPARFFLTAHGRHADLRRAGSGSPVTPAPKISINTTRRQIQILVPHKAWNPGRHRVRFAMGVGLWDEGNNRYLLPGLSASATKPGGAGTLSNPTAFFNAAFRGQEPLPRISDLAGDVLDTAWWRDRDQGAALAAGDLSPFHATVNFARLRARRTDNSKIPRRGSINRILASRYHSGQGINWDTTCGGLFGGAGSTRNCDGEYKGQLQPYTVYVPRKHMPKRGFGMTLLLHSLGANYNQYAGSRNQSQFGDRAQGSIVLTTESRGPDGGYNALPEAEVFEAWADVARRYRLDPGFTSIAGYSMGGFGTFRIGEQFPDLFARAQPTVGAESVGYRLASLRNVPVMMWNGLADELVNPLLYIPDVNKLDDLGYRYESRIFIPGEHLSIGVNDQFKPAADFLGSHRVRRNPPHVTFVADPDVDSPRHRIASNHAYWISGMGLRGVGTVDAFSHGFGKGDPAPAGTSHDAGTLDGGLLLASYPFARQAKAWGPTPSIKRTNAIDLTTAGVSSLTINAKRAHVSCRVRVHATSSDGPLTVRLRGCGRTLHFG